MRVTVGELSGEERLDRFLAGHFETSRAVVMKYLKEGGARVNGRRARPGLFVRPGDDLELPGFQEALERIRRGQAAGIPELPQRRPMEGIPIVYEDDYMVVVDKPAGLVMHPGKGHEDEGLDMILRGRFGQSVRLVHRIDRDTSGVVVAARGHPASARRLVEAFRDGDVEKVYWAFVTGIPRPAEGRIDERLLDTKAEGARVHVDPNGRPAATRYRILREFRGFSLLEVRPETGRRHQIRAHLQHLGHPLAVDPVYGRRRKLSLRDVRPDLPVTWKNPVLLARQPLHAASLTLRHPHSGEEATFSAPLAPDLEALLEVVSGAS